MKTNVLIIFIKTPAAHFTKTRLIPPFSGEQAALFYANCIKDLRKSCASQEEYDLWFGVAPENFDRQQIPVDLETESYFMQRGDDLGSRMFNAINYMIHKGYKKAVLIGSDLPSLDSNMVNKSLHYLDKFDVVFGPCEDGGYYLVALKETNKALFENIEWSTKKVLEQSLYQAKKAGIQYKLLPQKYDIDTIKEIQRLFSDLKTNRNMSNNYPENVWNFLSDYYQV